MVYRSIISRAQFLIRQRTFATKGSIREQRIGIIGLGSIGTVYFARIGAWLRSSSASRSERWTLDGLVKSEAYEEAIANAATCINSNTIRFRQSHKTEHINSIENSASIHSHSHIKTAKTDSCKILCYDEALKETNVKVDGGTMYDVLIICVKAYDIASVWQRLEARNDLLHKYGTIIWVHNGLTNTQLLRYSARKPSWRNYRAIVSFGAQLKAFGHVEACGIDRPTSFGAIENSRHVASSTQENDTINSILSMLNAAGLPSQLESHQKFNDIVWHKAIINAGINPICSLLNGTNYCLLQNKWSQKCLEMIVKECLIVAHRENALKTINLQSMMRDVNKVALDTKTNKCSMLADLRKKHRTEIELITGSVIAKAQNHNIATPVNEFVLNLIKALEANSINVAEMM